MAHFRLAALRDAAIHSPEGAAAPVQFATQELQRYLEQLTGRRVPIRNDPRTPRNALVIAADNCVPVEEVPKPGCFAIVPEAARIALLGDAPRDVLDAVYALLEQWGCRWSLHGPQAESVPRLDAAAVELMPVRSAPPFAVRGYCTDIMTWHYTQPEYFSSRLDDDRAFIDWMGKSGANAFFFIRHPFDTQLTIPELLPEFQRRGIAVEYGGHVIPLLLPRELYGAHPDYFPESPDGARTDYGNLCTSNPAALATASANAVAYVRDHPEMQVVHIWGADLWHGGWCHCVACHGVSVQDQSLRICNAVARGLADAGVTRPVCYLAYHDTIEPDLTERPDGNVIAEFAPRERCYGHALNDPECATNRRYAAALERYAELFDGRVRIFEYYGDAILFFGCAVPLGTVIAADLDYYRRLGIPGITLLQFGTYSLWAYPFNFLTFAAQSAGRAPVPACIDQYCAGFGVHHAAVRTAFVELEDVMRRIVTYGDIRRPPRSPDAAARTLARIEAAVPRLAELARRFEGLDDASLVGSSRVDLQACKLEYSIVSPK